MALSGVRSCSHFSPGFPCGPLHCVGTMTRVLRFRSRRLRPVHAVLRTRLTGAPSAAGFAFLSARSFPRPWVRR